VTVFATGKSGTIGKHLGQEVFQIDFRNSDLKKEFATSGISESDTLIHLAGIVGTKKVDENLNLAKKINLSKTKLLASLARNYKIKKFIYVSSSHVYGRSNMPLNENAHLEPFSNYAKLKLEAENMMRTEFNHGNTELKILRVFSVLGWECSDFTLGGTLNRVTKGKITKIEYSDDIRDFLTPNQIAKIILKLSNLNFEHQIVNIGSEYALSVKDACEKMLRTINFKFDESLFKNGFSKNPYIVADCSRLKKIFNSHLDHFDPLTSPIDI
jgi:nucleoside-diphosphate-sugar epimerase